MFLIKNVYYVQNEDWNVRVYADWYDYSDRGKPRPSTTSSTTNLMEIARPYPP